MCHPMLVVNNRGFTVPTVCLRGGQLINVIYVVTMIELGSGKSGKLRWMVNFWRWSIGKFYCIDLLFIPSFFLFTLLT